MARALGGGRGPTASTGRRPAPRSSRSTPRRPPSRVACTPATSSPTPTPTSSPATSACGAARSSTRWAGTTTASTSSAASSSMTGTIVDPTLPYDPDFRPPDEPRSEGPADPRQPAELHRAVRGAGRRSSRPSTTSSGRPSGCRSTGSTPTRRSVRGPRRSASAGSSGSPTATSPTGSESPTLWDVDMQTAVAQAELEDREVPGAYHLLRFTGPDGEPLPVDTTRPELLPACVAVVAHPDDERYQPLFGQRATTPLFGVVGPDRRPRARRSREGHRHRHGLHVRRHDRRHVVARARARPARRSSSATAGCARRVGRAGLGVDRRRRRPGRLRRARRQDGQAGPEAHRRAARRRRRARRRAPADHPPGQVLGQRHPAARDRHEPAVVHPLPAEGRAPRRGARSCGGAPTSCGSATRTGSTGSSATGTSPASASSASRSRRGTRSTPTATVDWLAPILADEATLPIDPTTVVPPATTSRSATSPAGSPPTPTSWTPGPRRR